MGATTVEGEEFVDKVDAISPTHSSGPLVQDVGFDKIEEVQEESARTVKAQIDHMAYMAENQYRQLVTLLERWEEDIQVITDMVETEISLEPIPNLNWNPYSVPDIADPETPTDPDEPITVEPGELSIEDAPVFTGVFPELDFSGFPEEKIIPDPGDAPPITVLPVPEEPVLPAFPDMPVLPGIDMPPPVSINEPVFTGVPPEFSAEEPVPFQYYEGVYQSDLFDTLSAKLIADLQASSSGIDAAVEQAMYDRAKAKLDAEIEKLQQDAENYFASKNHFIPPGALSGRLLEIQGKSVNAETDLLNDIVVQRSNLAQQNIQALVSGAVQLEGLLRQSFDKVWDRELEKQRFIAESSVALYNAKVAKFKEDVAAYQTESEVFKNLIQAEMIKVEAYKAQVEAAKVTAETQELLVKIYLAELQGIQTLVEIYKTRVESVKVFSEAETAKINAYRATVEAYVARVNAYAQEWQGYSTKVQAQGIKASAFGEQVKAYQTETQAWATQVEAEVNQAKLTIENNNSKINKYSQDIQKYQQDVSFSLGKVQGLIGIEDLNVKASANHADGETKRLDTKIRNNATEIDAARVVSGEKVAKLQASLSAQLEQFKLYYEKMKTQASVLGQIAASALSTFNTNMSYGFSGGMSGNIGVNSGWSASESLSISQSLSNVRTKSISDSESHNFSDSYSENYGENHSFGDNYSESHNFGDNISENHSFGDNYSESHSFADSKSENHSISDNLSESHNFSDSLSESYSENLNASDSESHNWMYYPEGA